MAILKKPYEISIWEDRLIKNVEPAYYKEIKIATIGTDKMTSPNKAFSPVLNIKNNGEKTFTFSMAYKYYDPNSEEEVFNPLINYLINERKVKLYYDDEWYDFLVKEHVEDSESDVWTFTLTDAFVNELSKVGYNIEFNTELNNNQGTAVELAKETLKNTDWQVDEENCDILVQKVKEPMYIYQINGGLTVLNVNTDETVSIGSGEKLYVFYSYIANQEVNFVQFMRESEKDSFKYDSNKVIIGTNYRIISPVTYNVDAQTGLISFAVNGVTFSPAVDSNYKPLLVSNQGFRTVYGQLTTYDPVMERTVDVYEYDTENVVGGQVYDFLDFTYTTSNVLTSYVTNGSSFDVYDDGALQGWDNATYCDSQPGKQLSKLQELGLTTYPEVAPNVPLISLNELTKIDGYLELKFNGAVVAQDSYRNTYFNSGIEDNAGFIERFVRGENYILRLSAATADTKHGALTPLNLSNSTGKVRALVAKYTREEEIDGDERQFVKKIVSDGVVLNFNGSFKLDNTKVKDGTFNNNFTQYVIDGVVVQNPSTHCVYTDGLEERVWQPPEDDESTGKFVLLEEANWFNNYYRTIASVEAPLSNEWLTDPTNKIGLFLYIDNNSLANKYIYISDIQLTKDITYIDENGEEQHMSIGNIPTTSVAVNHNFYKKPEEGAQATSVEIFYDKDDLAAEIGCEEIRPKYNEDCEKILSISESQSNCFNILQSICETFECWLKINVGHDNDGSITLDENNKPIKKICFKEYAGKDNFAGFKYGINLNSIQRTLNSDEIVTKLIVENTQNDQVDEGVMTIRNASTNPSGEANILNFDYFINKGLIGDQESCQNDLNDYYAKMKQYNNKLNELEKERRALEIALVRVNSDNNVYTETVDVAQDKYMEALKLFEQATGMTYNDYIKGGNNVYEKPTENQEEITPDDELGVKALGYAFVSLDGNYKALLYKQSAQIYRYILYKWIESPQMWTLVAQKTNTSDFSDTDYNNQWTAAWSHGNDNDHGAATLRRYYDVTEHDEIITIIGQLYTSLSILNNYDGSIATNTEEEYKQIKTKLDGYPDYNFSVSYAQVGSTNEYEVRLVLNDYVEGFNFETYRVIDPPGTKQEFSSSVSKKSFVAKYILSGGEPDFRIHIKSLPKGYVLDNGSAEITVTNGVKWYTLKYKILQATEEQLVEHPYTPDDPTPPSEMEYGVQALGYTTDDNNDIYKIICEYRKYTGNLDHDDYFVYKILKWNNNEEKWSVVWSDGSASGGDGEPPSEEPYATIWTEGWDNKDEPDHGRPDEAALPIGLREKIKQLQKEKDDCEKEFYSKYSRFIKEGTWSSTDYIDPELYYLDALQVSQTSAFPKVEYSINVVEISELEGLENYNFAAGDKSYIEDTDFFGWAAFYVNNVDNTSTYIKPDDLTNYTIGKAPVKEEVIVSEVEWHLDEPETNVITVQNYKTQFEDLFQRISATVQQAQYNEATYAKTDSIISSTGILRQDVLTNSLNDLLNTNYPLISNGSVVLDNNGILIQDLTDVNNKVRIDNIGLKITRDSGDTWSTVIDGTGIDLTNVIDGGLNTKKIRIGSSDNPSFCWDDYGISAYKNNGEDELYDLNTFVRFDQYGLYGIKNYADFKASSLEDIKDKAHFGVTWDGFFIKNSYTDGWVEITSDNDFRVMQNLTDEGAQTSNEHERIKIGVLEFDSETGEPTKYGIRINRSAQNGQGEWIDTPAFETDEYGNVTLSGTIKSDNYIHDQSGWIIDRTGNAEFNNVSVRGTIKSAVFEYNQIQAVGGIIYVRPSTAITKIVGFDSDNLIVEVENIGVLGDNNFCRISGADNQYCLYRVENSQVILIDYGSLNEPPAEGAALVTLGNYGNHDQDSTTPNTTTNNLGIGLNSSDSDGQLPARAITLVESNYAENDSAITVNNVIKGVFGELPNSGISSVDSTIYNELIGKQGIYTDNIYIGDANQYLAFYTDTSLIPNEKKLIIKAAEVKLESGNTYIDIADTALHFWFKTNSSTDLPAGLYITNQLIDSFKLNPVSGNTLITDSGIDIRKGVTTLASFKDTGLKMYGSNNPQIYTQITTDGFEIGDATYISGSMSGVITDNLKGLNVKFVNENSSWQKDVIDGDESGIDEYGNPIILVSSGNSYTKTYTINGKVEPHSYCGLAYFQHPGNYELIPNSDNTTRIDYSYDETTNKTTLTVRIISCPYSYIFCIAVVYNLGTLYPSVNIGFYPEISNQYCFTVGNGTIARHNNALTIDYDGNLKANNIGTYYTRTLPSGNTRPAISSDNDNWTDNRGTYLFLSSYTSEGSGDFVLPPGRYIATASVTFAGDSSGRRGIRFYDKTGSSFIGDSSVRIGASVTGDINLQTSSILINNDNVEHNYNISLWINGPSSNLAIKYARARVMRIQ